MFMTGVKHATYVYISASRVVLPLSHDTYASSRRGSIAIIIIGISVVIAISGASVLVVQSSFGQQALD